MAKKRTSLDSLFAGTETAVGKAHSGAPEKETATVLEPDENSKTNAPVKQPKAQRAATADVAVSVKSKSEIVKQTVYLPPAIHEQLRQLAFEERKKMHDYLVEGLDRVFKNRGLKPYVELSDATK